MFYPYNKITTILHQIHHVYHTLSFTYTTGQRTCPRLVDGCVAYRDSLRFRCWIWAGRCSEWGCCRNSLRWCSGTKQNNPFWIKTPSQIMTPRALFHVCIYSHTNEWKDTPTHTYTRCTARLRHNAAQYGNTARVGASHDVSDLLYDVLGDIP